MQLLKTTKEGKAIIIREANYNDAIDINMLAANVFSTTDQILTTPEEFDKTLNYQSQLNRIKNYNESAGKCILVAEHNNKLIGMIDFNNGNKLKNAHTGELGMGVLKSFRNQGVGRILMESMIEWGKSNPLIKKMKLAVFATNYPAVSLYKKLGFIQEGRKISEIKQMDGAFVDVIEMYFEV